MKIQILSIPRSGSSYLRSMINVQMRELDNYYSISEPFCESKINLKTHKNKNKIIKNIEKNKNVLVKNHYHQLMSNSYKDHISRYLNIKWFTICLLRKDFFEAAISRLIASETGIWDAPHSINTILNIDFDYLKKYIDETVYWTNKIKENPLNIKFDRIVYYEDLKFNSINDLIYLQMPIEHKKNYQTSKNYEKKNIVNNYFTLKEQTQTYLDSIKWI